MLYCVIVSCINIIILQVFERSVIVVVFPRENSIIHTKCWRIAMKNDNTRNSYVLLLQVEVGCIFTRIR